MLALEMILIHLKFSLLLSQQTIFHEKNWNSDFFPLFCVLFWRGGVTVQILVNSPQKFGKNAKINKVFDSKWNRYQFQSCDREIRFVKSVK